MGHLKGTDYLRPSHRPRLRFEYGIPLLYKKRYFTNLMSTSKTFLVKYGMSSSSLLYAG